MGIKNDVQLKLAAFAQKGSWNRNLVRVISSHLFWILLISFIVRCIYYSTLRDTQAVDTASYINYHANLLKGETDGLRTPIYPYFIKLIGLLGQPNLIANVVTAQIVLSFLSIVLFFDTVRAFYKSRRVVFVASMTYGAMLPVINFDKMILTESLSLCGSLLFIYMVASYLQKPAHIKAWALTLFVFVAIMLRPSFIYLLPLVILFWLLRLIVFKKDLKMCLSGIAASVVVILLILGYSNLNERNVGFNGISLVSNNNEMAVIVSANIYMDGNDAEISAAVKNNVLLHQKYPGKKVFGINIMQRFAPDRVHTFIVNCIENQPVVYTRYIGTKLRDLQGENIFTYYADHRPGVFISLVAVAESLTHIPFFVLYLFLVLSLISLVAGCLKNKQVPWFKAILWLLITGQLMTAIMGGYSEYQRLILPAVPALIILLFSYIDIIILVLDKKRLKNYPAVG